MMYPKEFEVLMVNGNVSWRVVDAWLAIPPCNYEEPYCHVQCPYFHECYPPEDEEEEEWP